MKWYEYIISNWAQLSVIIAAIGYILKVIFDYNYKKKEISFSYFTKEKMNSAVSFLQEYTSMAFYLTDSFTIPDLREKIKDREFMDDKIFPHFGLFLKSYGQLLLFYKEQDISDCKQILENVQPIIDEYLRIGRTFANSSIDLGDFQTAHNSMLKGLSENNALLRKFCEKCRVQFVGRSHN